jgi:hypothetical protein
VRARERSASSVFEKAHKQKHPHTFRSTHAALKHAPDAVPERSLHRGQTSLAQVVRGLVTREIVGGDRARCCAHRDGLHIIEAMVTPQSCLHHKIVFESMLTYSIYVPVSCMCFYFYVWNTSGYLNELVGPEEPEEMKSAQDMDQIRRGIALEICKTTEMITRPATGQKWRQLFPSFMHSFHCSHCFLSTYC